MSSILQPIKGTIPDFLTIGHVTRDILPDNTFSLGGTVTFAALTAYRLGLVAAIITCAGDELLADLPARLPDIGLIPITKAFAPNIYKPGLINCS